MNAAGFIAVELLFLAAAHAYGGPAWVVIGVLAFCGQAVAGVRLAPLAILVPALGWLALSRDTGNRELFFPYCIALASHVAVVLKPVVLEDHCFIGVNAVVMPGVTVGRAAVVASGAVVTTNVPALTMVAGNPAKIVKRFVDAPAAGGPPHHG